MNSSDWHGAPDNSANKFFADNAIKPIQRSSSYSSHQFAQTSRVGIGKSNSKLDPKKFTHREVFNSQLYQTAKASGSGTEKSMKKFFQISLNKK